MNPTRRSAILGALTGAAGGWWFLRGHGAGAADCPPPTTVAPSTTAATTTTLAPTTTMAPTTTKAPVTTTIPPTTTVPPTTTTLPTGDKRWSTMGLGTGNVTISQPVVLDVDVQVQSLTITSTGRLTFDNTKNIQLKSTGNVVVRGKLVSDLTARPDLEHRITFVGVDESKFKGGGEVPLPSDVGFWVVDGGVADLQGWKRSGWHRSVADLTTVSPAVTLDSDPVGWRVGDELAITPTLPVTDGRFLDYDTTTIKSISGRTVTFNSPLQVAHPRVDCGRGVVLGCEVLNLSRNIVVEGTAGHRAHVFVRSTFPQRLRHVQFQYLGPQRTSGDGIILGRYGVHFHMCANGSRGSMVEGCVVRKTGSHAYVPHMSNGVTFLDCIAHDTMGPSYWWDDDTKTDGAVYDHCVASLSKSSRTPDVFLYGNAGFLHQDGAPFTNVTRNCVAVGVQGNDSSGFFWGANNEGLWDWHDNVAHNIEHMGLRTWQNNDQAHTVIRGVIYRCDEGIKHGAYGNSYHYIDGNIVGCNTAVNVQAVSGSPDPNDPYHATGPQTYQGFYIDAGNKSTCIDVPDQTTGHVPYPIVVKGCDLRNASGSFVHMYHHGGSSQLEPGKCVVQGCTFTGSAPHTKVDSDCNPGSSIAVS